MNNDGANRKKTKGKMMKKREKTIKHDEKERKKMKNDEK